MTHRIWRYLLAILAGNTIYFAVERYLPPAMQHQPYQIDWGLAIDFGLCLLCFAIVRLIR